MSPAFHVCWASSFPVGTTPDATLTSRHAEVNGSCSIFVCNCIYSCAIVHRRPFDLPLLRNQCLDPPISLRIFYQSVSAARVPHVRDTSYENYTSGPSINRTDKRCPHIKSINLLIAFHPCTCATQLQCGKSSVADTDRQNIRSEIGGSSHPWGGGGGGGSIHTPGYLDRGSKY